MDQVTVNVTGTENWMVKPEESLVPTQGISTTPASRPTKYKASGLATGKVTRTWSTATKSEVPFKLSTARVPDPEAEVYVDWTRFAELVPFKVKTPKDENFAVKDRLPFNVRDPTEEHPDRNRDAPPLRVARMLPTDVHP